MIDPTDADFRFKGIAQDLDEIEDPYERIRAAQSIKELVTDITKRIIRDTVAELYNDRWTQEVIATNLGLSKQRVGQILNGN